MKTKAITMALALAAMVSGGMASAARPINLRQANQERRIDAGLRSGKLTRTEAARLKAEQRSIAALDRQLKRQHGGKLTAAGKRRIEAAQNRADQHILGQKADGDRGPNKLKIKI